jgi:hypothetical protein
LVSEFQHGTQQGVRRVQAKGQNFVAGATQTVAT